MPIPVSLTVKRRRIRPFFFCICRISMRIEPPGGVNFIALDSKLIRIWFSLSESPINIVSVRSIKGIENVIPFSAACGYMIDVIDSATLSRLKISWAIVIFPSSIFDISRTSLISVMRCLDEYPIFSKQSSTRFLSSM